MKKIGYIILVLAVVAFVAIYSKKPAEEITIVPDAETEVQNENEASFSGVISAVDTGCFADAICSVTVDGKTVILLTGMRLGEVPEVGTLKGVESIGDLEGKIGSTAKVYAAKTPEGDYTLYGNTNYYVEVQK